MTLPRYPEYRASGVEWLGELPDHWRVPSLGQVGTFEKGRGGSKDDDAEDGVPCVRYGDLYTGIDMFIFDPPRRIPVEIAPTYASLRPGDVVFTASGETVEDIGKSAVNLGASDIRCGGDLAILRSPQGFDSKYLGYATNSEPIRSKKASMSRGSTIKHIYASQLRSVRVPMPPLPEQHAIVAYLDRETARIDDLIDKKRRLLVLLKQRRTAVITHAVTKGLPTEEARAAGLPVDPPMKDSGVEWLGKVPAHWQMRPFNQAMEIESGQVSPLAEEFAETVLIAPNHIESRTGRLLFEETVSEQGAISGKYRVKSGDVLYSKIRPELSKVYLANTDCLCSADMYPMRVRMGLHNHYVYYTILSDAFTRWAIMESQRVAMPKINRESLGTLRIPVPPLPEQHAIVAYLDSETARIDELAAKVEEAIELLGEYRTALITAAVTGQVDVRGAVEAW